MCKSGNAMQALEVKGKFNLNKSVEIFCIACEWIVYKF